MVWSERSTTNVGRRTGWMWAIAVWYLISSALTLLAFYSVSESFVETDEAHQMYISSLTSVDYLATALMGVMNLAGAILLLACNRLCFFLFSFSLVINIALTLWHIATRDFLQTISTGGLSGYMIGFGLQFLVCIYCWSLIRRGTLS